MTVAPKYVDFFLFLFPVVLQIHHKKGGSALAVTPTAQ